MNKRISFSLFFLILSTFLPHKVYAQGVEPVPQVIDESCQITFPNLNSTYFGKPIKIKVEIDPFHTASGNKREYYRSLTIKTSGGFWYFFGEKDNRSHFYVPSGEQGIWEFEETVEKGNLPGEYGIYIWWKQRVGSTQICGPESFWVNEQPAPTPVIPTAPPGVTFTPAPTPTPIQCPICEVGKVYSFTEKKCCEGFKRGYCNIPSNPSVISCPSGTTCYAGTHCGKSPLPTPTLSPEELAQQQALQNLKKICEIIPHDFANLNDPINQKFMECANCVGGEYFSESGESIFTSTGAGAYTALGCLPTDLPTFFSKYLWKFGAGIAGGIAFLLMLWGAFNILISMGDPKRIEHGKELIISALTGLLFIIFSVLILRIIGVDIIKIPGFG